MCVHTDTRVHMHMHMYSMHMWQKKEEKETADFFLSNPLGLIAESKPPSRPRVLHPPTSQAALHFPLPLALAPPHRADEQPPAARMTPATPVAHGTRRARTTPTHAMRPRSSPTFASPC